MANTFKLKTKAGIDASLVDVYLAKDIPLPTGSSIEVMAGNKIVLQATDKIQVKGSVTDAVDVILSIMEIT